MRVNAALGGEEAARRLLLRLLSSVLDAAVPVTAAPLPSEAFPEVPAAMSLAGDPIRGDVSGGTSPEPHDGSDDPS